jgi:FlaA1/EpsC-like NDP-sugar epimerase
VIALLDRLRSRTVAFIHDLLMVPLAWMGAYWLRFNLDVPPADYLHGALTALPLIVPVQAGVFGLFGLYRGVWRFASMPDLVRILKAVLLGTVLSLGLLFIANRLDYVPRSVPLLFVFLQFFLLAGPRLLYRWHKDQRLDLSAGKRVLIVGAGSAGEMLVRDMLRDPERAHMPVAFVDDMARRQGSEIHGVPVAGPCERIPSLVVSLGIEVVVLAVPSADAGAMRRLVELCEKSGVPFRTVPKLRDLMAGQVSVDQLRAVSIEDLLGRDPVNLDWESIRGGLTGRDILVTGGGGSIGSELCRQIARLGPRRLLIFEISEFNLYAIELELRETFPQLNLEPILGDVTDAVAVERLLQSQRPQVVFHAAAYKHVPLLETQIREAVRVNVLGTRRMAEAAQRAGCGEFVLISTDKAVNPANVMGTTKRLAELFCLSLDTRGETRFVTVRFGNVLGSAGSVVPLFRRQIERGGPVTVTHPEVERFFMTIPEACQLIMQAGVIGRGGEILVLDMGEPINIRYLAEQMIRLSGRSLEEVPIEFIGLRPGEKLYEELFYHDEDLTPTAHKRIRVARHRPMDPQRLRQGMDALERDVRHYRTDTLSGLMRRLIPEWMEAGNEASATCGGSVATK